MCLLVLAACGTRATPAPTPMPDAAQDVSRDAPSTETSPSADTDSDGLCDGTEAARRTDRNNPDTDGDGLLDSFEVRIGSDPLSGRDPVADNRLLFREGVTTPSLLEHYVDYMGNGEVLGATVQDRTPGLDGRNVSDLFDAGVEATTANPAAYVRAIVGPRFVGVLGRVALQWRVTLTPRTSVSTLDGGIAGPLGCRRAYETQLLVKREGDDVVDTRRLVVEVAPPDGAPTTPMWPRVSADRLCLPVRCF